MNDNNSNEVVTPKTPDQGLASQDNIFYYPSSEKIIRACLLSLLNQQAEL